MVLNSIIILNLCWFFRREQAPALRYDTNYNPCEAPTILHFSFCPRTYGIALVAQCKRQKRDVQKNISFPFYNSNLFFQKMHCDSGSSESGGAYSHLFKRGDYGFDARRSIGIDKVLYLIVNILYALYVLIHCGICCECI